MKYRIFGHFYKNAQGDSCRKYLDVKEEQCIAPQPELILLMLNPGSCGEHKDIELNQDIEVKADPMLQRIQEFMDKENLSWVRLLNLSDVEQDSSDLFFQKLGPVKPGDIPEDSIFHPSRKAELFANARPHTPFLLAWGLDKRKEVLANTALKRLKEEGYPIVNEGGLPIHPLAKPVGGIPAWLDYTDKAYQAYLASKHRYAQQPDKASDKEKLAAAFRRFNNAESGHIVITAANDVTRRDVFASLVSEAGMKPFLGTQAYDYVYVDRLNDLTALYDLLKRHNEKKIILDAATSPDILTVAGGLELLEGALSSSSEGSGRRQVGEGVNLPDREPFTFKGKIALLTDKSLDQLMANKKFEHLLRDCIVV